MSDFHKDLTVPETPQKRQQWRRNNCELRHITTMCERCSVGTLIFYPIHKPITSLSWVLADDAFRQEPVTLSGLSGIGGILLALERFARLDYLHA